MNRGILKLYLISIVLLLGACATGEKTQVFTGSTMGTTYKIKVLGDGVISKLEIDKKLKQINQIFSTWDTTSELSLLNQQPSNKWVNVSDDLFYVLKTARQIYQQTNGYFDPGIGRLVNLWGFGTKQQTQKISRTRLNRAFANSSIRYLMFKDGANKSIRKTKNIHIDLSAIAKGYAVDEVVKLLNTPDYLVEIGGEVRSGGNNNGRAWTLGIERPNNAKPVVITLDNKAIATSGNYRQYFIWQGKRYAHIINPHNGLPANNNLVSVSVIHPQTMIADAYATAMMVMGSNKAISLAKRLNLSVVLILNQQELSKVVKINL